MPTELDVLEQQIRIETVEASLGKTRLDVEKLRQEIRRENKRFVLAVVGTAIALLGSGGVIGGAVVSYVNAHQSKAVAAPPQVIYIQPPAR